ncbi:hypothetical protein J2S89_000395 [Arthrobacter bambusae]|nr:hypothetical protein [Arthrobacter bambusae]MDQ0096619.1 hypothetical protein [Arthrobacter bambusae]
MCHLGVGRDALKSLSQLVLDLIQDRPCVLDIPGRPDHPAVIPQIALQLAPDGRDNVSHEGGPPARIERLGRLHEPQVRDLPEVGTFPRAAGETGREHLREIQML